MATDILNQIVEYKIEEVNKLKHARSENSLRIEAESLKYRRSFIGNMAQKESDGIKIIAEIKRASPSKGAIQPDLDAAEYAARYERGGAAAISVLTEQKWFKGNANDLINARQSTSLPILRKDFIFSTYQIYESVLIGADAVLLIARILSKNQLAEYLELCSTLNLDALVEIHSIEDLEKIKDINALLIGINNRNLKTFNTDINIAIEMAGKLSPDQIAVALSGIHTRTDIENTMKEGINNFLIGESIVKSGDPENFIKSLLSAPNETHG